MVRLWALTPMSVARSVTAFAVAIPLTALELVLGDGLTGVLGDRRAPGVAPVPLEPDAEPRFTRATAR